MNRRSPPGAAGKPHGGQRQTPAPRKVRPMTKTNQQRTPRRRTRDGVAADMAWVARTTFRVLWAVLSLPWTVLSLAWRTARYLAGGRKQSAAQPPEPAAAAAPRQRPETRGAAQTAAATKPHRTKPEPMRVAAPLGGQSRSREAPAPTGGTEARPPARPKPATDATGATAPPAAEAPEKAPSRTADARKPTASPQTPPAAEPAPTPETEAEATAAGGAPASGPDALTADSEGQAPAPAGDTGAAAAAAPKPAAATAEPEPETKTPTASEPAPSPPEAAEPGADNGTPAPEPAAQARHPRSGPRAPEAVDALPPPPAATHTGAGATAPPEPPAQAAETETAAQPAGEPETSDAEARPERPGQAQSLFEQAGAKAATEENTDTTDRKGGDGRTGSIRRTPNKPPETPAAANRHRRAQSEPAMPPPPNGGAPAQPTEPQARRRERAPHTRQLRRHPGDLEEPRGPPQRQPADGATGRPAQALEEGTRPRGRVEAVGRPPSRGASLQPQGAPDALEPGATR